MPTPTHRRTTQLISLAIFFVGLANMLSVFFPIAPLKLRAIEILLELPISPNLINTSRYFILLSGFFLILLSLQLLRRKTFAWFATVVLLVISSLTHMLKGFDWRSSIITLLPLAVLLVTRKSYTVRHDQPTMRRAVLGFLLSMTIGIGYGVFGFYIIEKRHFGQTFSFPQATQEVIRMYLTFQEAPLQPRTRYARWFLDSLSVFGFTSMATALLLLLQPVVARKTPTENERAYAQELLHKYAQSQQDFFKVWKDKLLFFTKDSFLAYRVFQGLAAVLGDPVAAHDTSRAACLKSFLSLCAQNDWTPIFLQTLPEHLALYDQQGLKHLTIGEEAIIDLSHFSLEGSARKTLRNSYTRVKKLGYQAELRSAPHDEQFLQTLKNISDEWLRSGDRREHTFTTAQFEKNYVHDSDICLVRDKEHQILAFVSLIPPLNDRLARETRTVDLMRRRKIGPNGMMEFLIVELAFMFQQQALRTLSLGIAPLVNLDVEQSPHLRKLFDVVYARMHRVFNFQGLYAFKNSFAPRWEPRYFIYKNILDFPKAAVALLKFVRFNTPDEV